MKKSIALLLVGILMFSGAFGTSVVCYAEEAAEYTEESIEADTESLETEESEQSGEKYQVFVEGANT